MKGLYGVLVASMLAVGATAGGCSGADNDNDGDDSEIGAGRDGGVDSGLVEDAGETPDTATETESEGPTALEIIGTYRADWGGDFYTNVTITDTEWLDDGDFGTSRFAIGMYDNDANYLVAQNSEDDPFNPSKWSRFEWTFDDDETLYYCQSLYAEETMAAAAEVAFIADTEDLVAGCNGFPWTTLIVMDVSESDGGVSDAGE